ncbi:MAG: nitroreductase [Acidimicrobiaceae bacterium]|nr:nitroreductase [Acidimicrobiaceae bacterium]
MEEFNLNEIDRLLTTTRAVRKRLDLEREVPRDLILDCVRVSTQAPAGGNYQKWRWVIVDDPDKKQIIADAYREAYAPYIEAQKNAVTDKTLNDPTLTKIMSSSDYLAEILEKVPVLAIPCSIGTPADMEGSLGGGLQGWWGSVLPAVWSYMLAARARGLGTAWTTLHLRYSERVGTALGIPDTVTQLACIPTAYYSGESFRPGKRKPAEQITYWNSWKETEIHSS